MMKYLYVVLFLLAGLQFSRAQDRGTQRVAIFAPLFLDSAFDADNEYRYAKNNFPKFINPGLEFYEGAHLALDSLAKEKVPLEVFIYDTRSTRQSLLDQLAKVAADSVGLIIAYCNYTELKSFGDFSLKKNIPLINANLPNDGGITGNPFFVVLNPTLKTQCEGIYRHVQRHYPLHSLVVFRKKGQLEDRIKSYFDDFAKTTVSVPLKLRYVELPETFTEQHIKPYLDTTDQTLCIAGSLDENFGRRLVQQISALKKKNYGATVMGMPTWDNIKDFNKPEYKGVEIIYSDPFYHGKQDKLSQHITGFFNKVMFARPSDMVFRGYEVTFRYARLLAQHGKDLASHLSSKQYKVFTDYDIQPVLTRPSMTLEYFENKKLYFLKSQDGVLKSIY